jgi:hypothetical protein
LLLVQPAFGSALTNGVNGINVPAGLNGAGIFIGQIEPDRPGDPDVDNNAALINTTINPSGVFYRQPGPPMTFNATPNLATEISAHAEQVAGLMISNDPVLMGVSPNALLYSAGDNGTPPDVDPESAVTTQHVISQPFTLMRAVNMSFGNPLVGANILNGDQLLTQFVDWSARINDILYVVAGNEGTGGIPIPTDNYNGMTVAYSERISGVWRMVSTGNFFNEDANGDQRTSVSLIAPGDGFPMATLGTTSTTAPHPRGTSFATPQVTGAAALLHEYVNKQITAGTPRFDATGHQHEVMKAVLMNSADKLIDDGTVMVNGNAVPQGGLLGMQKTIVKRDGTSTFLNSDAYDDSPEGAGRFNPLDEQMGAGALNVTRAVQQLRPGRYQADSGAVPTIGWDYGHTNGQNDIQHYPISGNLTANNFISITLAWDREVEFANDANSNNMYDVGDTYRASTATFPRPDSDDLINNLDVFLLPAGSATIGSAVAESISAEGTLQHIFFQIPTTGEYEIWVRQFDADIPFGQNYALAWWYGVASPLLIAGDYNGDQVVDAQDYNVWRGGFGSTVTPGTGADGSGNGVVDAADYVVWRKAAAAGSGAGLASVPEPNSLMLFVMAAMLFGALTQRRK